MKFPFEEYSKFEFSGMIARFFKQNKQMLFCIYPSELEDKLVEHQSCINHETALQSYCKAVKVNFNPVTLENMIQFHIQGDEHADSYLTGDSMVNNGTARNLEFVSQVKDGNCIKTIMKTPNREIYATQILTVYPDKPYVSINTEVENRTDNAITIDQLSSFSLGMISPFAFDDGSDRYYLHRRLAFWSAEGRLKSDSIEDLGFDRSWTAAIGRVERFGQQSTQVSKKYFPFAIVEDREAKAFWGVQLCAIGPWQMELVRRGDYLSLIGGMTDKNFANFERILAPGEKIKGMEAIVSVASTAIENIMNNLVAYSEDNNIGYSPNEANCPVSFNNWCTHWGTFTEDDLLKAADILKNKNIKYFVIDAGWFTDKNNSEKNPEWSASKGDWCVNKFRFPNGIKHTIDMLKAKGFEPGIWFEIEQVNVACAEVAKEHPEYFVQCYEVPYTYDNSNWVLDMRKKEVREFLHSKVTNFLIENGIKYLKTDYNYSMIGADSNNDSTQNGLYEYCEAVASFYRELKERIPDLTLEICASGGHRLSAAWMTIGDIVSVTDAHEGEIVPLIMAETAMQIPMRSNQCITTIRSWSDEKRFHYCLAAGFIGRLCLSGDIEDLTNEQLDYIQKGINFYEEMKPLVFDGRSRVEKHLDNKSWTSPEGYQLYFRENNNIIAVIVHTFLNAPNEIEFELVKNVKIKNVFKRLDVQVELKENGKVKISNLQTYDGLAILFDIENGF